MGLDQTVDVDPGLCVNKNEAKEQRLTRTRTGDFRHAEAQLKDVTLAKYFSLHFRANEPEKWQVMPSLQLSPLSQTGPRNNAQPKP